MLVSSTVYKAFLLMREKTKPQCRKIEGQAQEAFGSPQMQPLASETGREPGATVNMGIGRRSGQVPFSIRMNDQGMEIFHAREKPMENKREEKASKKAAFIEKKYFEALKFPCLRRHRKIEFS